ncbi:MAG: SdpI family protein [Candidatus Paceibacterota bacterium]
MSNPIKPTFKTETLPILFVALVVISSFYFYSHFPNIVPTHWGISGEVDGWGSRNTAFIIPAIIIGMYLMFLLLPFIDPKKEKYEQFTKPYHVFKNILILFMAVMYFVASFAALGYDLPVGTIIPVMVGLLFVIMGNYMSKIKRNWFIGIKTPWTLSSEEVWNKTHRFGGKMFIFGGILMAIEPFLPVVSRLPVFIFTIIILSFGTMGYSYLVYLKEKKNNIAIK